MYKLNLTFYTEIINTLNYRLFLLSTLSTLVGFLPSLSCPTAESLPVAFYSVHNCQALQPEVARVLLVLFKRNLSLPCRWEGVILRL